jgi:glycosyltransferase involved in cell wall biosynthesis
MKILIISDAWHPQVNGVVRTYMYLQDALEKAGHEVKIIGPGNFKWKIPTPGYSEIELALFPQDEIDRQINEFHPETIHIATEGPIGWSARKYCQRHDIPFTTSYHSQFPTYFAMRLSRFTPFLFDFFHEIGVKIIKRFHNTAHAMFVTTDSMTRELKSWGVTTPIYPLTRGIDTTLFYPGEKRLFQDLNGPIALYVGRLAVEKNLEEFLQMDWPGSKVVVGHGPEEENYKKRYPKVHFVGKKAGKELGDHYRSADVFVFPSYTDTFGIVLIEALACGLPVAAHPVTGPIDVIVDDTLGYLDPDLSVAAEKAMKYGSPAARHAYVLENYTWETAMQQFVDVIQQVRH